MSLVRHLKHLIPVGVAQQLLAEVMDSIRLLSVVGVVYYGGSVSTIALQYGVLINVPTGRGRVT